MKTIWIVANWKSNKNITEALDWIAKVGPKIPKNEDLKIVVCPTFAILEEVKKVVTVGGFPLTVGSQDLSPFGIGSYTGEEPAQIVNTFASIAILGHSERRQNFAETDEIVAKKVKQAMESNITPLVCVQGAETPIPEGCQLIAYEPIFAIGTGNPDTPDNADQIALQLKQKNGENLQVLYGGSVTSENVKGFVMKDNIAGVLIGKASLDAEEFNKIVETCDKI